MRALEPGDKVWLGGKVRLVGDVLRVDGEVRAASVTPDTPNLSTFETWSATVTGFGNFHSLGHAVLLPPWIDEPGFATLGEIQRVFAELHGEGRR